MNKLRQEAERLRAEGYSYGMINQKLGISRGTMSYRFKDKPFVPNHEVLARIKRGTGTEGLKRHARKVKEIEELKAEGATELGKLTKRDLWFLGIGLYIGEGAKTTEAIRIVNSDPSVIRLAIRWLKEFCEVEDDNITVSLHLYPDNDVDECKFYWQNITNLPLENFRWVSVDRRSNKSETAKGKLPHGTAHITVRANGNPEKGVRLFRRLSGWMTGALNQV